MPTLSASSPRVSPSMRTSALSVSNLTPFTKMLPKPSIVPVVLWSMLLVLPPPVTVSVALLPTKPPPPPPPPQAVSTSARALAVTTGLQVLVIFMVHLLMALPGLSGECHHGHVMSARRPNWENNPKLMYCQAWTPAGLPCGPAGPL